MIRALPRHPHHRPVPSDDDENKNTTENNDEEEQQQQGPLSLELMVNQNKPTRIYYKNLMLLLCNIFTWYYTNGMNGIAMQSFAGRVRSSELELNVSLAVAIISATTAVQLGMGALLGKSITTIMEANHIWRHHPQTNTALSRDKIVLGGLHCLGSIFTNLGFMYGSASLIQILKLLEPFETLLLSQLLLKQQEKISIGIVSSMVFSVSAAISLIQIQPKKPHSLSIVFALLSGMTLSLRNVLQRKSYVQQENRHQVDAGVSKVQQSVLQFTRLSLDAFLMTSVLSLCVHGLFWLGNSYNNVVYKAFNGGMFLWHPLYNTFSMITLGHCSALTHSLLNAGKRVFAVVMAIVWFREGAGLGTVAGLVAVGVGGCWYTIEKKRSNNNNKTNNKAGFFKLGTALLLVIMLLQLQYLASIRTTDSLIVFVRDQHTLKNTTEPV